MSTKTCSRRALAGGLLAFTSLAIGWVLYKRRPRERIVGKEEMDDAELAAGFGWVAHMPQMQLMRWFVARTAVAMPFWLLLWFATQKPVPCALRRANEPLASRNASYTPGEVARLAAHSRLTGWRVTAGPLWLIVEECRT